MGEATLTFRWDDQTGALELDRDALLKAAQAIVPNQRVRWETCVETGSAARFLYDADRAVEAYLVFLLNKGVPDGQA